MFFASQSPVGKERLMNWTIKGEWRRVGRWEETKKRRTIDLKPFQQKHWAHIVDGEVKKFLEAGFIREVKYTTWLANVVMVKKIKQTVKDVHELH